MAQSVFNNHYLRWKDLIKAAQADDISLDPMSQIPYIAIEEAIADSSNGNVLLKWRTTFSSSGLMCCRRDEENASDRL
jgi:hypothetical protein